MKPEVFLTSHSVFSREELATVLRRRGRTEGTLNSHLTRWRRQGRIARVKPGVFVRLDASTDPNGTGADYLALTSRMAPDAVLGYHTALEVHGVAQSVFERFTFLTWTTTRATSFLGRRFVPVRPRARLLTAGGGAAWIERAERGGVEVRVTTIERTIADVLDRPDLAGGTEEVWRSLHGIPAIDPDALERYVEVLQNRTLAAKIGYFLDSRRDELVVSSALLERLRVRIPRAPVFMDRSRKGRLVGRWALIVPPAFLEDDDEEFA
jgi:predicted transcriptional regulator of viral defense system